MLDVFSRVDRSYRLLLEEQAERCGSRCFLQFGNQSITFQELHVLTNRLANGLQDLGVRFSENVALYLPNCPEMIYFWWSLNKLGAVEVPVHHELRGEFLAYIVNDANARTLIISPDFLERIEPITEEIEVENLVLCSDSANWEYVEAVQKRIKQQIIPYSRVLSSSSENPRPKGSISFRTPVSIMYSSGTTGSPKGIIRTFEHDYTMAFDLGSVLEMTSEDRYYNCLPLSHGSGQYMAASVCLVYGSTLILDQRFRATAFWELMNHYNVTRTYFPTQSMLQMLWNQAEKETDSGHSLKKIATAGIASGMKLPFQERFRTELVNLYGSTEANLLTSTSYGENPDPDAVGWVNKRYEVIIVDENDMKLPSHSIGEIVCRPREPFTFMQGYYGKPKEYAEALRNCWLHTGDLGYFNERGELYFSGRKKEAIRRRGENISSHEIERIVSRMSGVKECVAIGVPVELGEEEIKISMILNEGSPIGVAEVIQYCKANLPKFMVPRYIEFRSSFPTTATGKVEKYKLKQEGITGATMDCAELIKR